MKTKTKTHGFKVRDKVKSNQPGLKYTGKIVKITDNMVYVNRVDNFFTEFPWTCKIVGHKVATANGLWDDKSYLKKITKKPTKKNESRRKK